VPSGTVVIREGEAGDRFYVVADGEVVVWKGETRVGELGRGDCFGEIALLQDRPRTATVGAAADEELRVSVLRRGPFLTAVTGYPAAASANEALAASRLGADAERLQPAG